MNNFGRVEKFCLEKTFVPGCIYIFLAKVYLDVS